MTISTATLFEYATYDVLPKEIDYYCQKTKTFYLTEHTLNELEKINKINKFLEIGRKTVRPLNYVGVVKTGCITIEILPKLFKEDKYEKYRAIIARNLLKMISYSENLSFKEFDSADLNIEELDFFEIFIYLFAKNLNKLLKSTQRKEYVKKSDELHFIRGRIDTRRYTNPARLHIVPCNYYELSIDNILNRTLKYTSYLMSKMVKSIDTFRLLRSISGILDSVTLSPVSITEIDRITFTRLNKKFEPFIRICRIFLSHSTLTLQASDVETFSFLIPMETLFEEFIAGVLKEDVEYFFGPRSSISVQKHIGKLAISEDGSRKFDLKPDIVVCKGSEFTIIDTKYKLLDNESHKYGVSQSDIYQMYAYVTKKDAVSSMLLYPDSEFKEYITFFYSFKGTRDKNVPLYIKSVKLSCDLTNEKSWYEFRDSLRIAVADLLELKSDT